MERRTFLSAGGVSALTLATGYAFVSTSTVSNDPSEVVEDYYRRASEAEHDEEFAEQIPDLAHSVSPLPDVAKSAPSAFGGALRQQLLETEVVDRDVDAATIRGISDFFAESVTDEQIASIAEDNAVVAVTLETDEVAGGKLAKEWLVAPEDGEWRLVWFDGRNSPRALARRFFREVSQTEFGAQVEKKVDPLLHSWSPLFNVADYTPWYFRGVRRQDLVGTEVVAEDIGVGEIASRFTPVTSWASPAEVNAIARENAVVSVPLSDDRLGVAEFEREWLLATVNDQWRLVWF